MRQSAALGNFAWLQRFPLDATTSKGLEVFSFRLLLIWGLAKRP